jgi:hypothetical protein
MHRPSCGRQGWRSGSTHSAVGVCRSLVPAGVDYRETAGAGASGTTCSTYCGRARSGSRAGPGPYIERTAHTPVDKLRLRNIHSKHVRLLSETCNIKEMQILQIIFRNDESTKQTNCGTADGDRIISGPGRSYPCVVRARRLKTKIGLQPRKASHFSHARPRRCSGSPSSTPCSPLHRLTSSSATTSGPTATSRGRRQTWEASGPNNRRKRAVS